jgi:hypothetical protein
MKTQKAAATIMEKFFITLLVLLAVSPIKGQQEFSVTYNFNNTTSPSVEYGNEAIIAEDAFFGGSKLQPTGFVNEENAIAWSGKIKNCNHQVFSNAFVRLNIYPKEGYKINIKTIIARQKGMEHPNNYFVMGCSLAGNEPNRDQKGQCSEKFSFTSQFQSESFHPDKKFATSDGVDYLSVWIGVRANSPSQFIWLLDDIVIEGTYEKDDFRKNEIFVSDSIRQRIKLGIDAERLWFWDSDMKEELARLAVGEMNTEYVRVAIDAKYEREKGFKNGDAYLDELEMMGAMKSINPKIIFFASPRPLFEAYSKEEREKEWGHKDNVPWSPYPRWILPWVQDGTKKMEDGKIAPKWVEGKLDLSALVQYFADYLNLMHRKGFEISYLDVTNEKKTVSPADIKFISEKLPKLLDKEVLMPKLVVPSSWDIKGATDWLKSVNISNNEQLSFAVASTHNTGPSGIPEEFVAEANKLGREIWNTELHEWVGIDLQEEIMTSDIFWKHMNAGFNGIDTWLFYGPAQGRGHTMIWVDKKNKTTKKSGKYEIFKQVVNNANGGNFVQISNPFKATSTAAFIKDNILSVWILNKSKTDMNNTRFDLGQHRSIANKQCEVYRWHGNLPNAGEKKFFSTSQNSFNYDIEGESLYFFKINLD